jgi:hypothetical protein
MMLLVRSSDRQKVWILGISENFKTLMNENIMNEKVSHSVQGNSDSDVKPVIEILHGSVIHQNNRRNSENNEEIIVFFQWSVVAVIMMIFVK